VAGLTCFSSHTVQAGSLSAHLPIVVEHINCWFSLDFCVTLLAVRLAPQICSWLKFNLHCRGCSQRQLVFTTFSTSVVDYNVNCRGCFQHQLVFTTFSTSEVAHNVIVVVAHNINRFSHRFQHLWLALTAHTLFTHPFSRSSVGFLRSVLGFGRS
jgi:ribosomal protein S27E